MTDAVKIVVYDAHDNILLLRRSQTHPHWPLHPDFPGGNVDPGEDFDIAALRELEEETGIKQRRDDVYYRGTWTNYYGTKYHIFEMHLEDVEPDIQISWEHDKHQWVPRHKLHTLDTPGKPDSFYELILKYLA